MKIYLVLATSGANDTDILKVFGTLERAMVFKFGDTGYNSEAVWIEEHEVAE